MKASILYTMAAATLSQAILPPPIPNMKLTFSDSFTGTSGSPPNSDVWTTALDIATNNELQTYTISNKNIQLSGGETLQLVPWKDANGAWTSGRVETKASWNAAPGKQLRWQAGLRMGVSAERQGMWPAFWMMGDAVRQGTNWPMCGELDIFEQVNGIMEGHGTVHCGQEQGGVCNEPMGRGKARPISDNEFHSWALHVDRTSGDWRTETIKWEMDGVPFHTLTGAEIGDEGIWSTLAHAPFYMILNVAVGGSWPGEPNAATEEGYNNMMEVQYVAVYETA